MVIDKSVYGRDPCSRPARARGTNANDYIARCRVTRFCPLSGASVAVVSLTLARCRRCVPLAVRLALDMRDTAAGQVVARGTLEVAARFVFVGLAAAAEEGMSRHKRHTATSD